MPNMVIDVKMFRNIRKVVKQLNITDVRIRKINLDSRMKAIVSVTFDDAFVVHDVKVVEGQKGLFVAMPSKKMPDGEFRDIAQSTRYKRCYQVRF